MNNYHMQLHSVFSNTQLHLYMTVAESSRFVPVYQRNAIITKQLKPYATNKDFKDIKNHLKDLLRVGRKGGDMEACINKMLAAIGGTPAQLNRVMDLVSWIVDIIDEKQLSMSFLTNEHPYTSDIKECELRLNRANIEASFDSDGQQTRPIELVYRYSSIDALEAFCAAFEGSTVYRLDDRVVKADSATLYIIEIARWSTPVDESSNS
ncbi:DUF2913 family protein [Shewanella oncorhynchi]|uniref:DUF2913 family protein n=1 Tax=Shewanella oncorhynchi TaxID=2726434 RepID=UPI003D7AC693